VLIASLLTINTIGFSSTSFLAIFGFLVVLGLCGLVIPLQIRNLEQ
jgi:hypothetical protein